MLRPSVRALASSPVELSSVTTESLPMLQTEATLYKVGTSQVEQPPRITSATVDRTAIKEDLLGHIHLGTSKTALPVRSVVAHLLSVFAYRICFSDPYDLELLLSILVHIDHPSPTTDFDILHQRFMTISEA